MRRGRKSKFVVNERFFRASRGNWLSENIRKKGNHISTLFMESLNSLGEWLFHYREIIIKVWVKKMKLFYYNNNKRNKKKWRNTFSVDRITHILQYKPMYVCYNVNNNNKHYYYFNNKIFTRVKTFWNINGDRGVSHLDNHIRCTRVKIHVN